MISPLLRERVRVLRNLQKAVEDSVPKGQPGHVVSRMRLFTAWNNIDLWGIPDQVSSRYARKAHEKSKHST